MKKSWLILFVLFVSVIRAQENPHEQVKKLYENFEYDKVIQLSGDLLNRPEINDSVRIDLYLMRAVSFFATGNNEQTKSSFQNILYIRKDYTPTTQILNPTMLRMFNKQKFEYLQKLTEDEARKDSVTTISKIVFNKQVSFGGAFLRNMILPGWGQLSMGHDRGLIYSLVYALNVGALIYYGIDASKKMDAYQKETDVLKFDQLYSDYNKSYKTKNYLFISWAVLLLYSQIDLLLFHPEERIQLEPNKISVSPGMQSFGNYSLSFRVQL